LLRRMRAERFRQPAILMSGNMPQVTSELKGLLMPGTAIAKPFSFSLLFSHLAALLAPANSSETPYCPQVSEMA
jgi:DNA-binding response OmpR family regulator